MPRADCIVVQEVLIYRSKLPHAPCGMSEETSPFLPRDTVSASLLAAHRDTPCSPARVLVVGPHDRGGGVCRPAVAPRLQTPNVRAAPSELFAVRAVASELFGVRGKHGCRAVCRTVHRVGGFRAPPDTARHRPPPPG